MQFANIQEACDYAVKKIVEQGGMCMSGGDCVYSDGHGRHCAVGWLLPESSPDEVWDHVGDVHNLVEHNRSALPDIITENIPVLMILQSFHDTEINYSRGRAMEALRTHHGIDTSGEHWKRWVDMAND